MIVGRTQGAYTSVSRRIDREGTAHRKVGGREGKEQVQRFEVPGRLPRAKHCGLVTHEREAFKPRALAVIGVLRWRPQSVNKACVSLAVILQRHVVLVTVLYCD